MRVPIAFVVCGDKFIPKLAFCIQPWGVMVSYIKERMHRQSHHHLNQCRMESAVRISNVASDPATHDNMCCSLLRILADALQGELHYPTLAIRPHDHSHFKGLPRLMNHIISGNGRCRSIMRASTVLRALYPTLPNATYELFTKESITMSSPHPQSSFGCT